MKSQYRIGLDLAWPRVAVVFLLVVAALYGAGELPEKWQPTAWWSGVGVAAVVALAGVVTYRGVTVPSALAGWIWDWSGDADETLTIACTPAISHQRRFGHQAVGIREYHGRLVSVIAVDESDAIPASRHLRRDAPPTNLPVAAVAAGLHQFETRLDAIDIVSVGVVSTDSPESGMQRSTWLILRMDPDRNSNAVATRDSVASTLAAATERLAHNLTGRSCVAWPMSGDELAEVDSAVLAGLQPTWNRPGWLRLKHFNGYATTFWVSPRDISSQTLEDLWLPETDATVVTVRLRSEDGEPHVAAWVRYHTEEPLPNSLCPGLNRFTGRQVPAVRASLPAPELRRLVVPSRRLFDDDEVAVPLSGPDEPAAEPAASS